MTGELKNECIFDGTLYRYVLRRRVPVELPGYSGRLVFIMLNPSTADEQKLDPTLTRCWKWTQLWRHREMVILNLFAFRTPHPDVMYKSEGPIIGEDNDEHIRREIQQAKVVLAWGAVSRRFIGRVQAVLDLIEGRPLWILGRNADGSPIHPLARGKQRVPDNVVLKPWTP